MNNHEFKRIAFFMRYTLEEYLITTMKKKSWPLVAKFELVLVT